MLHGVQDVSYAPLIFLILFSFCCFAWVFFSTLLYNTLILSSASSNPLFIPSNVLFIQILHSDWSFFMVSVFFHAVEHPYNHYFEIYI